MTSDLDAIAIRVVRDGRPISAFVDELWYVTDEELDSLPGGVTTAIRDALKASNVWGYATGAQSWIRHEKLP